MLKSIYVNGFRSLNNFHLELRPGLNVFVGPNGSGKSNILKLFEFVTEINSDPLEAAIETMGGRRSVFDNFAESNVIDIKLCGKCAVDRSFKGVNPKVKDISTVTYEYEMKINYDNNHAFPYRYSFQRLMLTLNTKNNLFGTIELIHSDGKNESPKFEMNIDKNIISIFGHYFEVLESSHGGGGLYEESNLIGYCSLLSKIDGFSAIIEPMTNDISVVKALSAEPKRIRSSNMRKSNLRIESDGSGLYNTLYQLCHNTNGRSKSGMEEFNQIVGYIEFVFPQLSNLKVKPLNQNDEIKIDAIFKCGKRSLPLNQLSDGTLKWLTLITSIITGNSIISIEEPENFLHIALMKEIVEIIRHSLSEDTYQSNSFALMTTHSESLIDILSAEELVITDLVGGYTRARRIKNLKLLRNIINEHGLPLGWFHFSGALIENEDIYAEEAAT